MVKKQKALRKNPSHRLFPNTIMRDIIDMVITRSAETDKANIIDTRTLNATKPIYIVKKDF